MAQFKGQQGAKYLKKSMYCILNGRLFSSTIGLKTTRIVLGTTSMTPAANIQDIKKTCVCTISRKSYYCLCALLMQCLGNNYWCGFKTIFI